MSILHSRLVFSIPSHLPTPFRVQRNNYILQKWEGEGGGGIRNENTLNLKYFIYFYPETRKVVIKFLHFSEEEKKISLSFLLR